MQLSQQQPNKLKSKIFQVHNNGTIITVEKYKKSLKMDINVTITFRVFLRVQKAGSV